MMDGHEVFVADNYFTGSKRNIEQWLGHENFEMLHHDIVNPLFIEVDEIYHLASPASPPHYMYNPVKTIKTNTVGTVNMLGLAKRTKARILNTYGPRMHANDGRVVSNFVIQALEDKPITIYGSGKQTRSFQYVSDLVNGLVALMNSDYSQPVNIGNPEEHSIATFA